jgi:2,4-dienoyl-CoA reductase-like NADH-dependent reductase (Old Yellow Enzyme family)
LTGYAYVNKSGQTYPLQNGVHTDAVIERWKPVIERVHEQDAKIAMQIVHGGRQTKMKNIQSPLAPSRVPNLAYFSWSRAMTEPEILQTIDDFATAAARVKEAGFDAVQIHAAHGYLISSFLSPLTNRRKDAWGGDEKRRFRFLGEVYKAVRSQVGNDFPVMYKMNVSDGLPLGLSPSEGFRAARNLEALGLDAIEISAGINEMPFVSVRGDAPLEILGRDRTALGRLYISASLRAQKLLMPFKENYFLPYAKRLKPDLKIPLMLVGGIRSRTSAEEIIQSSWADFVSMARPLVREPSLPKKWAEGSQDKASCISCNRCLGEMDQGNILRCYLKAEENG